MRTFWSSDAHLGHGNIIKYCNRPFRDAEHMNKRLIASINERCKPEDVLIHVGDFCCYGNDRGISGSRTKAEEWMAQINPTVIQVIGNHDKNNSVKGCIYGMVCKVSHWTCWVQHYPPWNDGAMEAPMGCDAYICGHVHEKWQVEKYGGLPVVNVGVDANRYMPLKTDEVITLIKKAQKLPYKSANKEGC